MALGEVAYQSGEGRSQVDIGLKGVQQELLDAVAAVNKNIVVVLMNGRPLVLGPVVERFMQDPTIAARGIEVARMLTGCFQAMHAGGFDCPSHWTAITGEPPPTLDAQMRAIKARLAT